LLSERHGNLVEEIWKPGGYIGITTNGFVKNNGECVMGRGIAKTLRDLCPGLAGEIGSAIQQYGNLPHVFHDYRVWTFPVKHNWWEMADLELIAQSARAIMRLEHNYEMHFNRPGSGNGRLDWQTVWNVIEPIFGPSERNYYVWSF